LNTGDTNTDGEAPSKSKSESRRPCSGLHPLRAHPSAHGALLREDVGHGMRRVHSSWPVAECETRRDNNNRGFDSRTWTATDYDILATILTVRSAALTAQPIRTAALRWLARRPDEFSDRVDLIEELSTSLSRPRNVVRRISSTCERLPGSQTRVFQVHCPLSEPTAQFRSLTQKSTMNISHVAV